MGNSTKVSITRRTGELRRASSSANGVPTTTTTARLMTLVMIVRRSACNTRSPDNPARNPSCCPARTSSATTGNPMNKT